jgi:glycosyltransferase involved in cell wall biosynthesis
MRVLHVIPSVSPADGGPSFAMPLIAEALCRAGISVDVATTDGNTSTGTPNAPLYHPEVRNGVNYFHFRRQAELYKVSWALSRWLARNITSYDLVHIHALFSYSSGSAAYSAFSNRIPYVVRPLGVLNRWGMANRRRMVKRLSFNLIESRILRNAAAVHYTSRQEKLEAEEAGVGTASAIIPLGIDLSEFGELPDPEIFYTRFSKAAGRKLILFLSRLDPKKGLDLLLPAFCEVHRQSPETLLVIAGGGDEGFIRDLKSRAQELKIDDSIIWTGFLGGEEKLSALAAASVFTLPSYSENFGIAAVEALAAGKPSVISDQVGIAPDVVEYDAGLVVPCLAPDLAGALLTMLREPELRQRLGANARRLAVGRFSTEAMSDSLVNLYNEVSNRELPFANFAVRNSQ